MFTNTGAFFSTTAVLWPADGFSANHAPPPAAARTRAANPMIRVLRDFFGGAGAASAAAGGGTVLSLAMAVAGSLRKLDRNYRAEGNIGKAQIRWGNRLISRAWLRRARAGAPLHRTQPPHRVVGACHLQAPCGFRRRYRPVRGRGRGVLRARRH